jgi:hypothetical protein
VARPAATICWVVSALGAAGSHGGQRPFRPLDETLQNASKIQKAQAASTRAAPLKTAVEAWRQVTVGVAAAFSAVPVPVSNAIHFWHT